MGEKAEIAVKVAEVLVSPITKLEDAFFKACGKIFEPIQIRRIAKAKAFELKTISEAIGSNTELAQAYNNGMVQVDNNGLNGLALRAAQRALYQETVKQQNIENVFQQAAEILENESDVTEEPISQDWMARFINSVETISDSDMQFLWAKVLSGEIKRPKSCSLRTLDTLMNLSKEEAILFQKMSSSIIEHGDSCYFINDKELLEFGNVSTDNILILNECGLVNNTSNLSISFTVPPLDDLYFDNGNLILYCQNTTDKPRVISFQVFVLTSVGKNLFDILNNKTDDEFIKAFGKNLKKHYSELNIGVYKITSEKEGELHFNKALNFIGK